MITVTKKHTISSAHRLYDYNGQCERLHGHNYQIVITLTAPSLNHLGMIIDFADIKSILIRSLEEIWDHKTLLYEKDPLCDKLAQILDDGSVHPCSFNPTAENMAKYLGEEFFPKIIADKITIPDLKITSVTVFETENNLATWQLV
ncbi:MAG: 6-carboxytetrahydropterin synthase [Desulfovibrionaceae bacterium]|nr:6-carboxytetrahydropterin synthase [Desulfovibrionaceae bacterium]